MSIVQSNEAENSYVYKLGEIPIAETLTKNEITKLLCGMNVHFDKNLPRKDLIKVYNENVTKESYKANLLSFLERQVKGKEMSKNNISTDNNSEKVGSSNDRSKCRVEANKKPANKNYNIRSNLENQENPFDFNSKKPSQEADNISEAARSAKNFNMKSNLSFNTLNIMPFNNLSIISGGEENDLNVSRQSLQLLAEEINSESRCLVKVDKLSRRSLTSTTSKLTEYQKDKEDDLKSIGNNNLTTNKYLTPLTQTSNIDSKPNEFRPKTNYSNFINDLKISTNNDLQITSNKENKEVSFKIDNAPKGSIMNKNNFNFSQFPLSNSVKEHKEVSNNIEVNTSQNSSKCIFDNKNPFTFRVDNNVQTGLSMINNSYNKNFVNPLSNFSNLTEPNKSGLLNHPYIEYKNNKSNSNLSNKSGQVSNSSVSSHNICSNDNIIKKYYKNDVTILNNSIKPTDYNNLSNVRPVINSNNSRGNSKDNNLNRTFFNQHKLNFPPVLEMPEAQEQTSKKQMNSSFNAFNNRFNLNDPKLDHIDNDKKNISQINNINSIYNPETMYKVHQDILTTQHNNYINDNTKLTGNQFYLSNNISSNYPIEYSNYEEFSKVETNKIITENPFITGSEILKKLETKWNMINKIRADNSTSNNNTQKLFNSDDIIMSSVSKLNFSNQRILDKNLSDVKNNLEKINLTTVEERRISIDSDKEKIKRKGNSLPLSEKFTNDNNKFKCKLVNYYIIIL